MARWVVACLLVVVYAVRVYLLQVSLLYSIVVVVYAMSVGLAYHLLCSSNLHLEFIYFIFITKN